MKKYTIKGEAVEVHEKVAGGYIVSYLYDSEEGEEQDTPRLVGDKLFDQPPTQQLEARVAELESRITEIQGKRTTLDQELRQAEANHSKLMARFKSVPALEYLQDYLDGKITHLVIDVNYDVPTVEDFETAIKTDEDRYDEKVKLLTLFGASKGNLQWNLSYYSDGSGGGRRVYPATSLEAAMAKAKEIVETAALATDSIPQERVIRGAKLFSANLPDGYERRFLEQSIQGNTESTTKEQTALDVRKQAIAKMKERLVELTK